MKSFFIVTWQINRELQGVPFGAEAPETDPAPEDAPCAVIELEQAATAWARSSEAPREAR